MYIAEKIDVEGNDIVRLGDSASQMEVSIFPAFGNNAWSVRKNGVEILWSPYASLAEWKAKPIQVGNPFLAPWCNRIDGDAFYANGKRYHLNPDLGNFRRDANGKPLHGVLVYASEWRIIDLRATSEEASVTSRLEFWRRPDWMAQFPFAHNVEMSYRLREGVLEVETALENLASEPMPVSLGFHTYYQVHDAPREQWRIHLAARDHVVLSDELIPTGATQPIALADPLPLDGVQLDDVFTNLVRRNDGRAEFWLQGKEQRISVEFGSNFPVAVVYAPLNRPFVCFEPMTGVTDVFNLAHAGKFPLQSVPPGGKWRESFYIRPSGF